MENASKALLIAGAILLVIAIIGIGMAIFGQAQGVVDKTTGQLDALAVQSHNSMFASYLDKKVNGKALRELCTKIATYNQQTEEAYKVTIIVDDVSVIAKGGLETRDSKTLLSQKVKANNSYLIKGDYDPDTGVIIEITAELVGGSSTNNN